jgi:ubiquinone/menaquinone biosynthesis C-methylase UbiE
VPANLKVVKMAATQASLEALVEAGLLPGPVFHPGGLEITQELADLCRIRNDSQVLDVACGTGETACWLAETFGCRVVGIDATELQIRRAQEKKARRGLSVEFRQADAHRLPFADGTFDVVLAEAILCFLDVGRALTEMVRVTKSGGRVGIHDGCWQEGTPDAIKLRFAEVENERPETLAGWTEQFVRAGLAEIQTVDKSRHLPAWTREYRKQLGLGGQFKLFVGIIRRWGWSGFRRVRESERIVQSEYMGYGIVVGGKPVRDGV